jgi:signal transduction histidine kinase
MFLKPLRRAWNKLGLRLTAWYSGLFILSTVSLFGTAYVLLSSSIQQRDREAIVLKLEEYAAAYHSGGVRAVEAKLALETNRRSGTFFIVRVAGPGNRTILLHIPPHWDQSNLAHLTYSVVTVRPWTYVPLKNNEPDDDDDDVLEIASLRLPNHVLLQVGASDEEREDLLERFGTIFAGVMIPIVVIGFATGAFLANRALGPLRDLLTNLRSTVATGDLPKRVPIADTCDEFEELGTLFNDLLDRIEKLVNGMQSSLDNVAHDLRTPMTRLRGVADLALQSEEKAELCREALANCVEESERIIAMLNTLMDISEAETGAMLLASDKVSVGCLIDDVVALYSHVAEDKGITICSTARKELFMTADRNRMLQVLANLMDNAIKYTPNGGRVRIEAYPQQREVVITVSDTGIGIPAEERTRIWERRFRGDRSRSQRGLGLGLSLVKAIVQAHQGRVEVYSETGQGSEFALHLPHSGSV